MHFLYYSLFDTPAINISFNYLILAIYRFNNIFYGTVIQFLFKHCIFSRYMKRHKIHLHKKEELIKFRLCLGICLEDVLSGTK